MMKKKYEEHVIVLDFLPKGHPEDEIPIYRRESIIQAIGENYFTILELVPKKNVQPAIHERIYIGPGSRNKIDHIKSRISFEDLTSTARVELPYVVQEIVKEDEQRFLDFFNSSRPLTTRMHQLELLPGIGKKTMWTIIEERKKKPFENFEDVSNRVRISDPQSLIIKRILMEIKGEDRRYIFARPPKVPM